MAAPQHLTDQDRAEIAAAIAAAERGTSGEVFCILAPSTSDYLETPLALAAAAALLAPPLALFAGFDPAAFATGGWQAGHAGGGIAFGAYAIAQAALFAVVGLVTAWRPLRFALTPSWLKAARVRRAAQAHFISTGLAFADDRTGVLIFAALGEHRVEIMADKLIHDAVGPEPWRLAAAALAEGMKSADPSKGFVRAIEICGGALARHFPATGTETNDFPDQIVEI